MRQKSGKQKLSAEKAVKDIRRKTRRQFSAEEQPGLDDGKEIRSFLTDTASG